MILVKGKQKFRRLESTLRIMGLIGSTPRIVCTLYTFRPRRGSKYSSTVGEKRSTGHLASRTSFIKVFKSWFLFFLNLTSKRLKTKEKKEEKGKDVKQIIGHLVVKIERIFIHIHRNSHGLVYLFLCVCLHH